MTSQQDISALVEGRSGGPGILIGVVAAVALAILALVIGSWYFALGPGQGTFGGRSDADSTATS